MAYLETLGVDVGKGKNHEDLVYSLAVAFNLLNNEMTAYLTDFNLTPAQFNVLMVIKHKGAKEGISQVDISKKLIVTASNMTRLLIKMEKQRLVERLDLPGDRRVKRIRATEKGVKLLDAVWPGYKQKIEKLVSGLSQDEQKIVSEGLLKLVESLV